MLRISFHDAVGDQRAILLTITDADFLAHRQVAQGSVLLGWGLDKTTGRHLKYGNALLLVNCLVMFDRGRMFNGFNGAGDRCFSGIG